MNLEAMISTGPIPLEEWMESRRFRVYPASKQLIAHVLQHGTRALEIVDGALPEDASLVDVEYDYWTVRFVFASGSFDPVPDGQAIPEIMPMFRAIHGPVMSP